MTDISKNAELQQSCIATVISRFSNTIELWLKNDINGNWIRNEKKIQIRLPTLKVVDLCMFMKIALSIGMILDNILEFVNI